MMNDDEKSQEQKILEERNHLEETLHEMEERYQALVETNLYGIQEIDIYGNITFMNSIQYQILGYEEGDLRGNQIWDILASDDDRNELTDYLTKIALGEFAPFPWHGRYLRKDGQTIELQIDWRCRWDSQDTVIGFVSIVSDILNRETPLNHFEPEKSSEEEIVELTEKEIKTDMPEEDDLEMYEQAAGPIHGQLSKIEEQLAHIQDEFQSKLKHDAHKDRMIDKLHKELQEYKGDIIIKYMKSAFLDLIQTNDNIRKLADYYTSRELSEDDFTKLLQILKELPSDLDDVFFRQGVNAYICEEDEFDAKRQKVLKTIETSDKSKDKIIAERLRPGYEWDDQVIRPEMVSVYVYKKED